VGQDSTSTSMIPERTASERLWVARTTAQLALRMTFSHSRTFSRKTGCPSMNQLHRE